MRVGCGDHVMATVPFLAMGVFAEPFPGNDFL
jgi:hypothetical protein